MSKSTLFIVFSFLFFCLDAQNLKVDWGPNLNSDSKSYQPTIIGEDDEFLYAADLPGKGGSEIILEKIDKYTLARVYLKHMKMPNEGKLKYRFEGLSFLRGKYVLFGSDYNRKNKNYILKAFVLDSKTGETLRKEVLFKNKVEKNYRRGIFNIYTSNYSEMILVQHIAFYKNQNQTKEKFKLINEDLNVKMEKSIIVEGNSVEPVINYLIDGEGSIYYRKKYDIVVYDVNQNYQKLVIPIDLSRVKSSAFVSDFNLSVAPNNDFIVTGVFFHSGRSENDKYKYSGVRKELNGFVKGIFFMEIDGQTKRTKVNRINQFDRKFFSQFQSSFDIKLARVHPWYKLQGNTQFIFKIDGGLIMISESGYWDSKPGSTGGNIGTNYHYLDLLVFNFSPEGELLWSNRIPKKQNFNWRAYTGFYSGSFGVRWSIPYYEIDFLSYIGVMSQNKIHLIFNDHLANNSIKNDFDEIETMVKTQESVPMVYTIDLKTGNKSKEIDLRLLNGEKRIRPVFNYQLNQEDSLYLLNFFKKEYQFGQISFSDNRME